MFNFLQKKYFLKDHLEDFVDIHNHILPGIDDGADNLQTSVELIKGYKELGIRRFIATPHVMNDYYPNSPERIKEAHQELSAELAVRGMKDIKIHAAAEYMMDQSFIDLIKERSLLTLKENMVLVEMSYFQAPINLNEILFKLQTAQYKPVLAHPERYVYFHSKSSSKYKELRDRGCLFQLNALSVVGHYGRNIQETAFKLLANNMIDFIGTDTHQLRHLAKLDTVKLNKKHLNQILPVIENTKETFSF